MNVAVVGAGCIGSVVAAHLAQAGHSVTLVARGERAHALSRDGLRVRPYGSRRERVQRLTVVDDVAALPKLDVLFVTVQMQQVEALLPKLAASDATMVCFLMNVHPIPPSWSARLGDRLVLGFPAMLAGMRKGCVVYQTLPSWMRFAMISTLGPRRGGTDAAARKLVRLFNEVGLSATTSSDMESWLASHSALMTPLMGLSVTRIRSGKPLVMTWPQAKAVAQGLHEALSLARASGATLTPTNVAALRRIPAACIAASLWCASRSPLYRRAVFDYAEHAEAEVRAMYHGLRAGQGASKVPSPRLDALLQPIA